MKILITGATGMVGKNVTPILERTGFYTIITPTRSELNLLDQTAVTTFLQATKPDLVIHLAAKVGGIQANMADPCDFLIANTLINTNVIQAALSAGVRNFLNLGSSCMYPRDRDVLRETDLLTGELEPTNEGYAIAKISAARLCDYINKQYGLNYKTLIPCNLYGPYDNFDEVKSHLIPAVIHKLHHAKHESGAHVSIWGDGEARREFMYVGDLAEIILSAIPILEKLPTYLNVGLGFDYSITEYYQTAAEVIGYNGKFHYDLSKPAGMKRKLLDISIMKKLGWEAKTSLRDGIAKTYQYYLQKLREHTL